MKTQLLLLLFAWFACPVAADTNSHLRIIGTNLYDFAPIMRENPTNGPFVIQGRVIKRDEEWILVEQDLGVHFRLNGNRADVFNPALSSRGLLTMLAAQQTVQKSGFITAGEYMSYSSQMKRMYEPVRITKSICLSLSPNQSRTGQQVKSYGVPTGDKGWGIEGHPEIKRHTFGKPFTGNLTAFSGVYKVSANAIKFEKIKIAQ